MVGRGGVDVVPPRRLEPDDGVAVTDRGDREPRARDLPRSGIRGVGRGSPRARPVVRAAFPGARGIGPAFPGAGGIGRALPRVRGFPCGEEERVGLGVPPAFVDGIAHRGREGREERAVVVEGKSLADRPARNPRVRRPRRDGLDEGVAVRGQVFHPVPGDRHRAQELDGAGRGVEPDPVAEPPVPVRVVREHDRDAAFPRRRRGEVDPRARKIRAEGDPVRPRRVGHDRALGQGVEPVFRLERNGAGEDAPVHLREGDVHRDVARGEPVRPLLPLLLAAAREHHLEDRSAAGVEGGRPALGQARRRDRESGGVEHDARAGVLEHGGDEVRADRVLQARDVDGERVHPARPEGRDQRVDGSEVRGLDVGAVEDDGGDGGAVGPLGDDLVEAARPGRGVVEPGARERGGLTPLGRVADEIGGEREQAAGVRRPPVHQVLPQAMGVGARHGAEGRERGVRLVVAGQEREGDRPRPARLDELLHPVGPVAGPAEHPGDDELRPRDDGFDVDVHRHRVGELHEVREPQRGEVAVEAGARAREARELGVRGGEEDDVARGLAEVDRLGLVDRGPRLRPQQVHRCPRPSGSGPVRPREARPGCAARRARPPRSPRAASAAARRLAIRGRSSAGPARRPPGRGGACPCPRPPRNP